MPTAELAPSRMTFSSTDPLPNSIFEANSLPELTTQPTTTASRSSKKGRADEAGTAWRIETSQGPLWLQGDTILCACPDCGAPMTVRLWLLLAQCWQCGTQIALSEEQQRAVETLLAQKEAADEEANSNIAAPIAQATVPEQVATQQQQAAPSAEESIRSVSPARRRANQRVDVAHDSQPSGPANYRRWQRRSSARRATPAWLVSLVLHFVLILLLVLIAFGDYTEVESITLSSFVSEQDREGGVQVESSTPDAQQFELPLPPEADLDRESELEKLRDADQAAAELRDDPDPVIEMPEIDQVRERLSAEVQDRSHFIARDPRLRVEMVKREGGSTLTEAAVSRGLSWLARHQNKDGSWSLENYENSHRASNQGDCAATALALLPFLGAGQTHEYGRYKETVSAGLMWLISRQKDDGDLRAGLTSQIGMYAHGQATIVLVEALALTGDERFRGPAQRAIQFICDAQHDQGGWRYRPGQLGDTSVLGWQLMALQSARSPGLGLEVPDTVLQLANYYLDLASSAEGALYAYQPATKNSPTPTMTAEALLCRMYLGWPQNDPRLEAGLEWVAERAPASRDRKNIYYWYYATQAFHNYGGSLWTDWNSEMQTILVDLQETRGRNAGSWSPNGFEYGSAGGRIYVTALAVCTLEVYYRHLPIFRQVELNSTAALP